MQQPIDRRWLFAVAVLLLLPQHALANNTPGPQTGLGFIAMLFAIPVLTYIGGGETILARLKSKSLLARWIVGFLKVLAVLVFVLCIATASTSGIALLAVLAYGIYRGIRLIAWGVKAGQPEAERPEHVAGASRWRLISAGSLLIITLVALTHMAVAFVSYHPSGHRVSSDLIRLAKAMKEAGERNKGVDGLPRYTAPGVGSTGSYEVEKEWYHALKPEQNAQYFWHAAEVRVAADGKSFQAWAWPRVVPYWPWNNVMPVASFYIDQTR